MSVKKGDIVLVPFPFTDLSTTKLRPAVVLWVDSTGDDITLCFISSQNLTRLSPDEFVLDTSDPEFSNTGLKVASKVRVTRIVTLERRLITRRIGKLGVNQIQQLNSLMLQAFQLL
ncbi:type II toxin-antitoxin system PemK/MazF family toxin [Coleofasciculus sp. E2-BRE-01]|jgi:mRNA interferase MazF|uniref:type II toxin-antitoxin system PemK/MazF family toxin n=1 Tax=unclassified Coleofasciculus TaxID=2692782 RepID=UPI0032F19091